MDYKIILSPSARRDLRDIVRYISFDAPETALAFGRFLLARTRMLARQPLAGRIVPEFGDPAIREIIVRSYRIVHRVNEPKQMIEIARFWHAARGVPEIYPGESQS